MTAEKAPEVEAGGVGFLVCACGFAMDRPVAPTTRAQLEAAANVPRITPANVPSPSRLAAGLLAQVDGEAALLSEKRQLPLQFECAEIWCCGHCERTISVTSHVTIENEEEETE